MSSDLRFRKAARAVTDLRSNASGRQAGFFRTALVIALLFCAATSRAVTLWSDPGATLVFENGAGRDILAGALKRDDFSNDTLYFKFHIDPQSDASSEEYFAAFELFEGDAERLGIGNALKAWAYSAFVKQSESEPAGPAPGYVDLHSSAIEPADAGAAVNYEFPRRGVERTIVFKVQYVAGGDDLVTVWLNPDLSAGANEVSQSEALTTRFNANASFDEVRLRHSGGGAGWIFSGLAVATSFSDFVDTSSAKPASPSPELGFAPQRLTFQSWRREPGMPRSGIRALAQTRDGYLWLGGEDIVARFDGSRFYSFDLGQRAGGSRVQAMLGDSRGSLWIGATTGLFHYSDGQFHWLTSANGLPTNSVTALAEDSSGRLWVGTAGGLRVWVGGKLEQAAGTEALAGRPIDALATDRSGSVWIGVTNAGVFQFQSGTLTAVTNAQMEAVLQQPHCLLMDRAGRLWVGAGDDSVLCREKGQWRRFRIPGHSPTPYITSLAEQPDGTVWAGSTTEGLFQFKSGKLTALNAEAGLADNRVSGLLVDRDGCLWVSSDAELTQVRRSYSFALGPGDGLGFGAVKGLAEVAPGVVWAIKPNDGLYRWDGRSFSRLTAAGLTAGDENLGPLLTTPDGSCWVACKNGLLLYRDPQALADEGRLLRLTNGTITALAAGDAETIWAGTREGGLWTLKAGFWSNALPHLSPFVVSALLAESNSVWIATEGAGLFRWDGKALRQLTKDSGLAGDVVRTLYRGDDGGVWIGTASGLSRLRNGKLETFTVAGGLPENAVSQILEDRFGRLWLGGDHGIFPIREQDLNPKTSANSGETLENAFARANRGGAEPCSTGFSPAGLRTRSGLLWFSTQKGVVLVDPQQLSPRDDAIVPALEEVLVDGVPTPISVPVRSSATARPGTSASLTVPPGKHQIELHYTVPYFDSPEQLRFRYRLEGSDADWVDAGARRAAVYNYVPPGTYHFRVEARQSGGSWREAPATLAVDVSRHFWQHWWVMVFGGIALLAGVGGAARYVEKKKAQRRMKRLEQERALERERHRIAQDLHDEMGAKPCRISFLSEHAQRDGHAQSALREQIHTIADESRGLLHTLDEIVWAVNPQNDTLEHLASYINQYAQNYFNNTGIECALDMPAQFPPYPLSSQARHHLFLAVHEAFTNILKHSGATHARLAMACARNRFEITVEDDGKGFDTARSAAQASGGSEDGLRNMRQRLESIGGSCRVESNPGRGTTIYFILPLTQSREMQVKP